MTTCRTELLRQGGEIFSAQEGLKLEWRNTPQRAEIFFPATSPSGFDIGLAASDDDLELTAGGFHSHFDDNPDPEEFVQHALGFVRDLLSPGMRLRELAAGRTAYRWVLEARRGSAWVAEEETGLLFWPYWAVRSERTFINDTLPVRD